MYTRAMGQADRDRISKALGKARAKRESGQRRERTALDEIADLAVEGLGERMTKVEIADLAGINRITLDKLIDKR